MSVGLISSPSLETDKILPFAELEGRTPLNFSSIQTLPEELLLHIFSFLNIEHIGKINLVQRSWNRIANEASLWKRLIPTYLNATPYLSDFDAKTCLINNYCIPQKIINRDYTLNGIPLRNQETIICFTVNHGLLITGSNKGKINIYNSESMQLLRTFHISANKAIQALTVTYQTLYIATVRSCDCPCYNYLYQKNLEVKGEIQKWNWQTGEIDLQENPITFNHVVKQMNFNGLFLIIQTYDNHLFCGSSLQTMHLLGKALLFTLHQNTLYFIDLRPHFGQYDLKQITLTNQQEHSTLLPKYPYAIQCTTDYLIVFTNQELHYFELNQNLQHSRIKKLNDLNLNSLKEGETLSNFIFFEHLKKLYLLNIHTQALQDFDLPLWFGYPFFNLSPQIKLGNQKIFLLIKPIYNDYAKLVYYDFKKQNKTNDIHFYWNQAYFRFILKLVITCLKVCSVAFIICYLSIKLKSFIIFTFSVSLITKFLTFNDLENLHKIFKLSLILFKSLYTRNKGTSLDLSEAVSYVEFEAKSVYN